MKEPRCLAATVTGKCRLRRESRERGITYVNFVSMDQATLANMRARVAQCRRLAASITDARAAAILRQMADEGDADIARVEAEQSQADNPMPPPAAT